MQERLVVHLRNRVRAGELTERNLARITGMSQPHMHNVLKGIRSLSPEYADQIVEHLNLSVTDLLTGAEIGNNPVDATRSTAFIPKMQEKISNSIFNIDKMELAGVYPMPRSMTDSLVRPVMVNLAYDADLYPAYDADLYPQFQEGDLALIDRAPSSRESLSASAVYLVQIGNETLVRAIRRGGSRLYFVTPRTLEEPRNWQSTSLSGVDLNSIVRGRVVWIGRQLASERFYNGYDLSKGLARSDSL